MQLQAAFYPRGPVYLVTTAAVNCPVTDTSSTPASYRVRCILASGDAYLTWGNDNTVSAAGAPSAGVPSAKTIGMTTKQTEVFNGIGPWFISSVANAFEVTPGEGV